MLGKLCTVSGLTLVSRIPGLLRGVLLAMAAWRAGLPPTLGSVAQSH